MTAHEEYRRKIYDPADDGPEVITIGFFNRYPEGGYQEWLNDEVSRGIRGAFLRCDSNA